VDVSARKGVRSRVDGEGNGRSPEGPPPLTGSVRERFNVNAFAEALYRLGECLVDSGVMLHYEEYVSERVQLDFTKELNARIEQLVIATQGETKWQDADVDLVFEAVHATVARPDSRNRDAAVGR